MRPKAPLTYSMLQDRHYGFHFYQHDLVDHEVMVAGYFITRYIRSIIKFKPVHYVYGVRTRCDRGVTENVGDFFRWEVSVVLP